MNSDLQNLTVRYLEAREAVKSVFRMESEYSFPAAANLYVAENAPVDTERLTDCKRLVRDEAGIFSNFRGSILVPLAAKLALSEDPKARWDRAAANYAVLKEQFLRSEYLALAASVHSEDYYLKMMVAWYFATALAKQYDETLPYIEQCRLDPWVHKKAIQKALESFRVTPAHKEYLKSLR